MGFDPAELEALRRLVGRMIPASAEFNVPGADDASIFQAIVTALEPHLLSVRALLQSLSAANASREPGDDGQVILRELARSRGAAFAVVVSAVARAYYSDERVMRSLGLEPRPPFPRGFAVKEGDWALLEPVRARGPIWRPAP